MDEFRKPRFNPPARPVLNDHRTISTKVTSPPLTHATITGNPTPRDTNTMSARNPKLPRRKIILLSLMGCVVLLVVAGTILFAVASSRNPISQDVLKEFGSPSFYPSYLPPDFILHPEDATVTGGALTFTAFNAKTNQTLFFSEQAKQPNINLDSFYQTQIPDKSSFATANGDAVVGHFTNVSPLAKEHLGSRVSAAPTSSIGSLNTPKTWVVITAPANFDLDKLKQVVVGLRQAN